MELSGYQIRLLPVNETHLEQLRHWRNSNHVREQMLDQTTISEKQQIRWFESIKKSATHYHFVIEYKHALIGSCNFKRVDAKSFGINSNSIAADNLVERCNAGADQKIAYELGLYIGDERFLGNVIAFSPTLVLNDFCFNERHADCLLAVVKKANQAALRYNEALGYEKVREENDLVYLRLSKEKYDIAAQMLKRLLNR